jgi:predicted lipid-binding transport protein (Tim44 family)
VNQLKAEILVGQRYRFLHRMGVDLYTETWKAFDTRLGRPVALQLLAEHARNETTAADDLRAKMRARPDATPPRVIDSGEDPLYGPFVVSELVEAPGTIQGLPTLDGVPSPSGILNGRLLLFAVVGGILVLLAAFAVFAYVFDPGKQSPAVAASATQRPQSGAQPGGPPTPRPTAPPTLAAPAQAQAPNPQPTSSAAAQPTQPSGAQPTPAAGVQTNPSAVPAKPVAGTPVDTIRQHYSFIDAKRYAEGYALMDAHLRSLNSAAEYQGWFADKISIKTISVDLKSQTDTEAVVRSTVETTDRVNGQNVTKQVSEEFVLHAEDGAWRIDQVSSV